MNGSEIKNEDSHLLFITHPGFHHVKVNHCLCFSADQEGFRGSSLKEDGHKISAVPFSTAR